MRPDFLEQPNKSPKVLKMSDNKTALHVGDFKIIYDPSNPANAAMLYSFAYWTSISVFFLYFLFTAIIVIAFMYVEREGPFK